ncbi:MAG: hypothetical protein HWE39_07105 [Oceanospirillaceae bacterium]|nr:hypothetical protein [Oceanospirillaceae bacterium]
MDEHQRSGRCLKQPVEGPYALNAGQRKVDHEYFTPGPGHPRKSIGQLRDPLGQTCTAVRLREHFPAKTCIGDCIHWCRLRTARAVAGYFRRQGNSLSDIASR